jgi:hypothetical protein
VNDARAAYVIWQSAISAVEKLVAQIEAAQVKLREARRAQSDYLFQFNVSVDCPLGSCLAPVGEPCLFPMHTVAAPRYVHHERSAAALEAAGKGSEVDTL